jgi:hypothetical protein
LEAPALNEKEEAFVTLGGVDGEAKALLAPSNDEDGVVPPFGRRGGSRVSAAAAAAAAAAGSLVELSCVWRGAPLNTARSVEFMVKVESRGEGGDGWAD